MLKKFHGKGGEHDLRKAIPLLDIYPREMKAYIHTKTCILMFLVELFIIAPNWKQPKSLATGECMAKTCKFMYWNTTTEQ